MVQLYTIVLHTITLEKIMLMKLKFYWASSYT
jgi:hypothetical protein